MSRTRATAVLLVVLALARDGCVGTETTPTAPTETTTPTATPLPQGGVDVPDGPKEPPERPVVLNESSVREFVGTFEYRVAYDSLSTSEYTEVTLACRVDEVSERPWGYEAVVTCTGHSDTDVPENATVTPTPATGSRSPTGTG